jgi:DNA repair exonuclease SbcCD nuclease subunit
MKIGFTADAHLKAAHECPERYNALINVLDQCRERGVEHLVIAGDLFDKTLQNYTDFESICKRPDFSNIKIHIIPGNHDPDIRQEHFSVGNIQLYTESTWVEFDSDWSILFIPYVKGKSMGEIIEKQIVNNPSEKWALVGHGDWSAGMRSPNPYEPGVYMPVTQKDITIYKPDYVILGHIHIPLDTTNLYYPGSPCGLDITETGYRRFLVLDTETNLIEPYRIQTDVVYFIEELLVLPADDEVQFIRNEIQNSIKAWGLEEADKTRVKLRVRARGFCSNKVQLLDTITDSYKPYRSESDPDISGVFIANDPERDYLMDKVQEKVDGIEWEAGPNEPGKNEILLQAMHFIYGEK